METRAVVLFLSSLSCRRKLSLRVHKSPSQRSVTIYLEHTRTESQIEPTYLATREGPGVVGLGWYEVAERQGSDQRGQVMPEPGSLSQPAARPLHAPAGIQLTEQVVPGGLVEPSRVCVCVCVCVC
ncbi:hypothetical protein E2C01_098233 [Portunus trituberculatus]|uniref:Uncharacterized protein n=1 Tax=Portunus trituberculatus TaxID=210409 RepID=A0A5B7K7V9_PORTR|nr:hypothetical protein [Portunus trituberculatus]